MQHVVTAISSIIFLTFSLVANANESTYEKARNIEPYAAIPDELPVGFVGNDLRGVIESLQKNGEGLGIIKDEYTPKKDFMKRASDSVERLNTKGKYLFVYSKNTIDTYKILSKYDADKQAYKIHLINSKMDDDYKSSLVGIEFAGDKKDGPSYNASNAFGVAVSVSSLETKGYVLGFSDETINESLKKTRLNQFDRDFSLSIPMSPDEARELNNQVAVVFVSRLAAPPLLEYKTYFSPTIRTPIQASMQYSILYTVIEQLWVVNVKTGKIYAKIL